MNIREIKLEDKGNGVLYDEKNLVDGRRFYISVYRDGDFSKLIINDLLIKATVFKEKNNLWKMYLCGKVYDYAKQIEAETRMASMVIEKMVARTKLEEKELKLVKWEEEEGKYKKEFGKTKLLLEGIKDRNGKLMGYKLKINGKSEDKIFVKRKGQAGMLNYAEKQYLWKKMYEDVGYLKEEWEWEEWAGGEVKKYKEERNNKKIK
jgi:hypothetical protein